MYEPVETHIRQCSARLYTSVDGNYQCDLDYGHTGDHRAIQDGYITRWAYPTKMDLNIRHERYQ